jgi:hypothetical protein
MKSIRLLSLFLAALALSVMPMLVPVADAASNNASRLQRALEAAQRGHVAVLTPEQWNLLMTTQPDLFRALNTARETRSVPILTTAQRKHVEALTKATLARITAGQQAKQEIVVTPKAGQTQKTETGGPAGALQSCIAVFGAASTAFPGIGTIIGGILCVLILVPLIIDFLRLIFGPKEAALQSPVRKALSA